MTGVAGTKRILTVSLNAAVDVSYMVSGFAINRINTVSRVHKVAGGKANNVARVLSRLGERVTATGFAGGNAGRFIIDDLAARGIETDFVATHGENRTCLAVVDPVGNTLTEIREQGPELTAEQAGAFVAKFRFLLPQVDLVIISGSLPPGIPADFYGRLVREAYQIGQVRCIVDASGKALLGALPAQPYMVKPNRDELQEWVGAGLPDEQALLAAARKLMQAGPLVVAVSLGADGLLLVSPEGAWRAVPPRVNAVNTVGSGDSLVAGLAAGLMRGLPAEEILRLAVGCGTANALTDTVAEVNPEDVARIAPKVQITRIA